ncbi:tail fiber domain-containing protein [Leclercia sp. LSNIH1]|uniref:tail fiber domain-containing protein n=1 Tax=Leclercia sp. LSNIH1 TaxID=1920114 RepID=UPI002E1566D2
MAQLVGMPIKPNVVPFFDTDSRLKTTGISDFAREVIAESDAAGVLSKLGLDGADTLRDDIADPAGAENNPELQMSRWRDEGDVRSWGAKVDGVADDTAAFNSVLGIPARVPEGTARCSPGLFSVARLIGSLKSKLKQVSATGNFLSFRKPDGGRIANLDIESSKGGAATTQGHQLDIQDGNDVTLENLNFKGAEGTGFSIILYNNTIPYQTGFIVKSIRGKYTKSVSGADAGCVLLALNRKSIVDGVIATGYPQFGAVELKDDARHNITTNVIGDDCENGVYLGTQTSLTPNGNIINNVLASKPGFSAVEAGGGHNNLISNVMADYTDSAATQAHGATTTGDANVFDNVYMQGCTGVNSIGGVQTAYHMRFRDSAKNNYASIFPHYTASGIVNFEVGTTRNFVEIKHPGARTSIFAQASAIGDKSTITGDANSNVVHAPALGQYFGTMSGTFEWRIKDIPVPAGVFVTADRFRFMCDGAVSMAVGGGTTAQLKLFNSDGTTRTISLAQNQTLRLDTGSGNYLQVGSTTLTPNQTNAYTLGSASNAWAGGTTQTAFTVLSDGRAKGEPLMLARGYSSDDITSDERVMEDNSADKMLDAWSEVDLVQYQLLDRIEAKGEDGARWHFGIIAQRAVEAFARHGLDAHRFAFLCYDEWDAEYEPEVLTREIFNEVTEEWELEQYETGKMICIREAGDRYGIRYEEALILEAALQRRTVERLLTNYKDINSRLVALEAR